MAFTAASLADGQLSVSTATIYSPSGKKAIITFLLHNTSTSLSQTVNIYITRSGGTRRQIDRAELPARGSADWNERPISLSDGDALEADASNATTVDFTVFGAEE